METPEVSINPDKKRKPKEIREINKETQDEISLLVAKGQDGETLKSSGFDLHNPLVKEAIVNGLSKSIQHDYYSKEKRTLEEKLEKVNSFGLDEQEKQEAIIRMVTKNLFIDGPDSIDAFIPYSLETRFVQKILEIHPEVIQTSQFKERIRDMIIDSFWINSDEVNKQIVEFIKKVKPEGFAFDEHNKEDDRLYKVILGRTKEGRTTTTEIFSPVIHLDQNFFVSPSYVQAAHEGYCYRLTEHPRVIDENESIFKSFSIDLKFKETPEYHNAVIQGYKNVISQWSCGLKDLEKYETHYGLDNSIIYSPEIESTTIDRLRKGIKDGSVDKQIVGIIKKRYSFPEMTLEEEETENLINNAQSLKQVAENIRLLKLVTPAGLREKNIHKNHFLSDKVATLYLRSIEFPFLDDKDRSTWDQLIKLVDSGLINEDSLKDSLRKSLSEGQIGIDDFEIEEAEELYRLFDRFNLENCFLLTGRRSEGYAFSPEIAPKTLEEFLQTKIIGMPEGMLISDLLRINKTENSYSIKTSLLALKQLSFPDDITPVFDAQGDAAYFYIGKMRDYFLDHKNLEGLRYVAFVGKKYGVNAADIYEYLLKDTDNLAQKKDIIERYLADIKLPSRKIFNDYEKAEKTGNWQEIEKIKEKVKLFSHQIYYGLADENSYKDEYFVAIAELIFPPAVTSLHKSVEQIFSGRPDRRHDIPETLDKHQYQKVSVETGKYLLGEQRLDITPWQEIQKITLETNSQFASKTATSLSDTALAEKIANFYLHGGQAENWPWADRYRDLYLHFLSQGNQPLETFDLVSRDGLMSTAEFIEDTIKADVLQNVIESLRAQNPEKYQQLESRVLSTTKIEWNHDVSLIKNLVNISKKQKDESQKQVTISRLEDTLRKYDLTIDDVTSTDESWVRMVNAEFVRPRPQADYRTEEYYNSPEFITALDRFTEKRDPQKKTVDRINNSLFKDVHEKMSKELAKFKFVDSAKEETKSLEFIVSKKKEHCIAGLNMGVCVTPDEKLWNDPTFMNCIFLNPETKRAQGGMHFLIREDYLTLPGINPSLDLLGQVDQQKLFDQIVRYAKEVSQTLGLKGVLIPTFSIIHSNRRQIQTIIANKKYPTVELSAEAKFSYSPHKYSFQKCFVV